MRASRYSRSGSRPWSNMSLSTRLRRARAARVGDGVIGRGVGHDAGDQRGLVGLELLDAQVVARAAVLVVGLVAEVGARGRLDAVGAVAEVDRVQVLVRICSWATCA